MADTLYFFEVNHNACSRRLAAVVVPGLPLELVLVEVRSEHTTLMAHHANHTLRRIARRQRLTADPWPLL